MISALPSSPPRWRCSRASRRPPSPADATLGTATAPYVPVSAQDTTPDQVIQWNQELEQVLVAPGARPASIHPTRTLAITQIAVYDAVTGILGGGEPLLVHLHGPQDASAQAAAAAAARTALDALLPTQQPAIDAFFQSSLKRLGSGKRRGARHPLRKRGGACGPGRPSQR